MLKKIYPRHKRTDRPQCNCFGCFMMWVAKKCEKRNKQLLSNCNDPQEFNLEGEQE